MNRRQQTTSLVATVLAAMLLYYDAAWAILRCCDVGEHGYVEEILPTGEAHDQLERHFSRSSPLPSQIDCLDVDHQIEVLIGPTSPLQFQRGTFVLTPYGNDFFILKSLVDDPWKNRLRNIFTRGSVLAEPSDPPLYLSLSSLRI